MYNEKEKKFEKNWEDAQKAGNAVGKDITVEYEVLEALDEGHVNESHIVGILNNDICKRKTTFNDRVFCIELYSKS